MWCVADGFLNTNMQFAWLIYTSLPTYAVTPAVIFQFSNRYAWTFGYANFWCTALRTYLLHLLALNFFNTYYFPLLSLKTCFAIFSVATER